MVMVRDHQVVCPRCGSKMMYIIEAEGSNKRRIRYYYRCPVCGYKLEDLAVSIEHNGAGVVIEVLETRRRVRYPLNIVRR